MPSIEELRAEKERLELEARVAKLHKQKDRREAVEKTGAGFYGWVDRHRPLLWAIIALAAVGAFLVTP